RLVSSAPLGLGSIRERWPRSHRSGACRRPSYLNGAPMIRVLVAFALLVTALAAPAHGQIAIDIGIRLPGPPALFVVQGSPVYYAPNAPANVFFYAPQYWVFTNGWYVGPTWNGPWALVEPPYIPGPLLRVPVAYYRVPPPQWREWRRDGPPHWE